MKKFWDWMEKRGVYDRKLDLCNLPCGEVGVLSNQMLIGYMIEYLYSFGFDSLDVVHPTSNNKNIEDYYTHLELMIEGVGELI